MDTSIGEKRQHHIHWGVVDNKYKFTPNRRFIYATPKERESLIFPKEWDLKEIEKVSCQDTEMKKGRGHYYGEVWLFEQIIHKLKLREELEMVFDGNHELVSDILKLVLWPYLPREGNGWRDNTRLRQEQGFKGTDIMYLTRAITREHCEKLMAIYGEKEQKIICAETGKVTHAIDKKILPWKEYKYLVYSAENVGTLIYSFPSKSLVCRDERALDRGGLEHVKSDSAECRGQVDTILFLEGGERDVSNLSVHIVDGHPFIMCVPPDCSLIAEKLQELVEVEGVSDIVERYPQENIFSREYDFKCHAEDESGMKLRLYFERTQPTIDPPKYQRGVDKEGNRASIRAFGVITHKVRLTELESLKLYRSWEAQREMRKNLNSKFPHGPQHRWLRGGENGRKFVLFVFNVLQSYINRIWMTTNLNDIFYSPSDMLDYMHAVRCMEEENEVNLLTPSEQELMCIYDAFDIDNSIKVNGTTYRGRHGWG